MKRLKLLVLFMVMCCCVIAQKQVKYDSLPVEQRSFNADELKKIKADKAFQYDRYTEPPQSLWDRFWNWFWYKVSQLLSTSGGRTTVYTVLIVLAAAVLIFFILKVMKMNKSTLFGRNSSGNLAYSISSENIHGIQFDEAIQEAIASSNFRLAIRLLYLQSLKKLSDNGYITWQLNKTNTHYLLETADKKWHPLFSSLTNNFEYTWYGESQVDKEKFQLVREQFTQLNNQL